MTDADDYIGELKLRIDYLNNSDTWKMVTLPEGGKFIKNKRVYVTKHMEEGEAEYSKFGYSGRNFRESTPLT